MFLSIKFAKVYKVLLWPKLICGVNKNEGSIKMLGKLQEICNRDTCIGSISIVLSYVICIFQFIQI